MQAMDKFCIIDWLNKQATIGSNCIMFSIQTQGSVPRETILHRHIMIIVVSLDLQNHSQVNDDG